MKAYIILLAISLALLYVNSQLVLHSSIVTTQFGQLQGTKQIWTLFPTRSFFSIPFALPPVQNLRFKPPVAWSAHWTGVRDATYVPASCIQTSSTFKFGNQSEDCLYLNVYTPLDATPTSKLPVMFWIYGGAFVGGDSYQQGIYDGSAIAQLAKSFGTPVVIVTSNYRLGSLGFVALDELKNENPSMPTTGNYGFEDQRMALQWTINNIEAFGGDPHNIMMYGESAGAISTCLHLTSPRSSGLFQRAGMNSPICQARPYDAAKNQSEKFVKALNCDVPDSLSCMRSATVDQILAADKASQPPPFDPTKQPSGGGGGGIVGSIASWWPVIDGYELIDQPLVLMNKGQFYKVPTLLGSNLNETNPVVYVIIPKPLFCFQYPEVVENLVGKEYTQQALQLYPCNKYKSAKNALGALTSDSTFHCSTYAAASALSKYNVPVYLYSFEYVSGIFSLFKGIFGCFHGLDISYTWNNPIPPRPLGWFTPKNQVFSEAMVRYYTHFAKSGNPNNMVLPNWPVFNPQTNQNLRLYANQIKIETIYSTYQCQFWNSMPYYEEGMITIGNMARDAISEIVNGDIDDSDVTIGCSEFHLENNQPSSNKDEL